MNVLCQRILTLEWKVKIYLFTDWWNLLSWVKREGKIIGPQEIFEIFVASLSHRTLPCPLSSPHPSSSPFSTFSTPSVSHSPFPPYLIFTPLSPTISMPMNPKSFLTKIPTNPSTHSSYTPRCLKIEKLFTSDTAQKKTINVQRHSQEKSASVACGDSAVMRKRFEKNNTMWRQSELQKIISAMQTFSLRLHNILISRRLSSDSARVPGTCSQINACLYS